MQSKGQPEKENTKMSVKDWILEYADQDDEDEDLEPKAMESPETLDPVSVIYTNYLWDYLYGLYINHCRDIRHHPFLDRDGCWCTRTYS